MECPKCHSEAFKKFGTYGDSDVQRYRCKVCGATRSDATREWLPSSRVEADKAIQALSLLTEGTSMRAISRHVGMHRDTVASLLVTTGANCQRLFDDRVRGIRPKYIELDELWNFVHTKEKRLKPADPNEWGDTYTWTALDSQTKLLICYLVGKRDAASAHQFVRDLSSRVVGRTQATSDGFRSYIPAMEEYFGADVDFAQLVKIYGKPDNAGPDWYGPGKVIETVPTPISGTPDERHICTSHVERSNLTFRMHLRRFTRLTNGFSKKLTNLRAAVSVYAMWYNFVRVHQTLRVTPAMEAGIANHIWSINELLT